VISIPPSSAAQWIVVLSEVVLLKERIVTVGSEAGVETTKGRLSGPKDVSRRGSFEADTVRVY